MFLVHCHPSNSHNWHQLQYVRTFPSRGTLIWQTLESGVVHTLRKYNTSKSEQCETFSCLLHVSIDRDCYPTVHNAAEHLLLAREWHDLQFSIFRHNSSSICLSILQGYSLQWNKIVMNCKRCRKCLLLILKRERSGNIFSKIKWIIHKI